MGTPPRGLRWADDSPVSGRLRPRISRFYFCLFAALWNFSLGPGREMLLAATPTRRYYFLDAVGVLACVLFMLLAVRESVLVTQLSFTTTSLTIRTPWAPWLSLELPTEEIESFGILEGEDGKYEVRARVRGVPDVTLPLSFETVPVRASWTRRAPFASPVSYASFLAGRLTAMLAAVRERSA